MEGGGHVGWGGGFTPVSWALHGLNVIPLHNGLVHGGRVRGVVEKRGNISSQKWSVIEYCEYLPRYILRKYNKSRRATFSGGQQKKSDNG